MFLFSKISDLRDSVIINNLSYFLVDEKNILDVGCGDGRLSQKIVKKYMVKIHGVDVFDSGEKLIDFTLFDGKKIPFKNNFFDSVLLVDVLHHLEKPELLLDEAFRVSKKSVIIKDHFYENNFDLFFLKIFDFLGNIFPYAKTPFNFKSKNEWEKMFKNKKYKKIEWRAKVIPLINCPEIMFKIKK
jgi:ubiquinone/menaquinone biosynthesis C-methylase UbiE